MKFLFALVALSNILLIATCSECCNDSLKKSNINNAINRYAKINYQFAADVLRYLIRKFPGENVNGSPLVSLNVGAVLGLYACGCALKETLRALNFNSKKEMRSVISQINEELTGPSEGVSFSFENVIFANAQYPLSKSFKRDVQELLSGKALNTDFCKPDTVAKFINTVIAKKTLNEVTNIITDEMKNEFSEQTQLLSVTGLYFNVEYKYRFDTNNITKGLYYGVSGTREAEYTYQKAVYDYTFSKILNSDVIAVPFKKTYIGIVIYPKRNTNLNCVLKQIGNYKVMKSVYESLEKTVVELTAPNLNKITTKFETGEIVKNSLGITSIFDPNCPPYEGITNNKNQCVTLSGGIQKFVYEGNSNGGPLPDIPKDLPSVAVKINRPYFYLIVIKVKSKYLPVISSFRGTV